MVDLLSSNFGITISGTDKIKTKIGTFTTLSVIGLTVAYAIFSLVNMLKKDKVFVTTVSGFATSFTDPTLGTLSKNQGPLEIAIQFDFSSACPSLPLPAQIDWSSVNLPSSVKKCSARMNNLVQGKGFDPQNFLCYDLSALNFKGTYTYMNFPTSFNVMSCAVSSYAIRKICYYDTIVDVKDEAAPFRGGVQCFDPLDVNDPVNIFFTMTPIILETDTSQINENIVKEHIFTITPTSVDKALGGGTPFNYFNVKVQKKFIKYSRSYQKVTTLFATVNGVWGFLLLCGTVVMGKLMRIERNQKLYYRIRSQIGDKNHEMPEIGYGEMLLGTFFFNKKAREKMTQVDKIAGDYLNSKIELSHLIGMDTQEIAKVEPMRVVIPEKKD